MAYNDSDLNELGSDYQLGDYSFSLQAVVSENEKVIQAHMSDGTYQAAKGITVPASTYIGGWYVEANGNTATVYASTKKAGSLPHPIPCVQGDFTTYNTRTKIKFHDQQPGHVSVFTAKSGSRSFVTYWVSSLPFTIPRTITDTVGGMVTHDVLGAGSLQTIYDKPVYVFSSGGNNINEWNPSYPVVDKQPNDDDLYSVVYGDASAYTSIIVARFRIDLETAGGGPEGGTLGEVDPSDPSHFPPIVRWEEPGDVDYSTPPWPGPDPDPRPTKTLYLTVNGALSGRHNDPLEDTSYSYLPMDKNTTPDYGCGGDGGSGGGGGAGASTVVVRRFATGRADSKDITALAKRHGYGSGGGKGGSGGDGIILVYY